MSTEDLRIIKTRKAIKETFLAMRHDLPVEKIFVRELCRKAMINKSTFYNHYQDIYELENELENEAIEKFLNGFSAKDCLFDDPIRFISEMPPVFDANMEQLLPLFRENLDAAFFKLEEKLRFLYVTEEMTETEQIKLSFILNGTLHTLRELKFGSGFHTEELIQSISALIESCNETSC